jgi:hypothetical protein
MKKLKKHILPSSKTRASKQIGKSFLGPFSGDRGAPTGVRHARKTAYSFGEVGTGTDKASFSALSMPRLFEIVPTITSIRHEDGSVEHDGSVMYFIGEDAVEALDAILEPYGEIGGFYLDRMNTKSPIIPWAYIALRKEYDIAEYICAQRDKLSDSDAFKFTFYDSTVDISAAGFVPKVGCFIFFSKDAVETAAQKIPFLQTAWSLLREMSTEKHWLLFLDEDPTVVLAEAIAPR